MIDRLMELFQRKVCETRSSTSPQTTESIWGERFEHVRLVRTRIEDSCDLVWAAKPATTPASVVGVIRQEDYAPTVLDMLGVEAPSTWTGESLSRASRNERSLHAQAEWWHW